jgi:glycerol-3-phosphate dehydrogenase (NAD(P)+)
MASPLLVLGAGSWGTALAIAAARSGERVCLWGHDPAQIAELAALRENRKYLPGVRLPENIAVLADLRAALLEAREVLIAVPCSALRETVQRVVAGRGEVAIAWACKGMEQGTGRLFDQMIRDCAPGSALAVVSGPTFAHEVAIGLPAAVTVAANDARFAASLAEHLHSDVLRAYVTDDLAGVQVGGAVKNVIAIAAGIADGLRLGANSRAALITRGLAEITRLGIRFGGRSETFMGLSGLGDLVLSCTDDQSRNRRLGRLLATGTTLATAMPQVGSVIEGVATAHTVAALAVRLAIKMPIATAVSRVLQGASTPADAVRELLAREPAPE